MTREGRERSGEGSVGPYYLRTPFTEQRYMHAKFEENGSKRIS